jgi:outer membrane protein assembly factor BamA
VFRDTDVGFGGGLAITDIDFRAQRRREFGGLFLSYSVEGQQSYTAVWRRWLHQIDAPEGGVFQEERSFLQAAAGYEKALTRRFYGFGADSSEEDESSYTDQTAFARFGIERALRRPGDDLVWAVDLQGEWHGLADGRVSGAPSTSTAFPLAFASAENQWLGWIGGELRYDTRDSQLLPYRGFNVGARIDSALFQSGWDVAAIFSAAASKIFRVPPLFHDGGDPSEEHPPTDTIAFQLSTRAAAGDLPFFSLPSLGGSRTLRGYIEGRFRDRASWHLVGEYRFWVIPRGFRIPFTEALRVERLGLALFGETGSVDEDWWGLFTSRVRASGGVGLRFTLERSAPFRVDVGFSSEGVEVNAGFGLTF